MHVVHVVHVFRAYGGHMKMTRKQCEGLFQRLNQGGCPVQPNHSYKVPPFGLAIEKIPGISHSEICDLMCGGTGYAIELGLRNDLDRPIDIVGFQIETPWGVPKLSLVPPWRKAMGKHSPYHFSDGYYYQESIERYARNHYYEGEYVVNYLFARKKSRLKPGEEVEGMLLVEDKARIPDEFPDHARIIVTVRIFDSRRNRFEAQFRLVADRSALHALERAKHATVSAPEPFFLPMDRDPLPLTVEEEAAERARKAENDKQWIEMHRKLAALAEERKQIVAKEKQMAAKEKRMAAKGKKMARV
jgi:hypothetical protein